MGETTGFLDSLRDKLTEYLSIIKEITKGEISFTIQDNHQVKIELPTNQGPNKITKTTLAIARRGEKFLLYNPYSPHYNSLNEFWGLQLSPRIPLILDDSFLIKSHPEITDRLGLGKTSLGNRIITILIDEMGKATIQVATTGETRRAVRVFPSEKIPPETIIRKIPEKRSFPHPQDLSTFLPPNNNEENLRRYEVNGNLPLPTIPVNFEGLRHNLEEGRKTFELGNYRFDFLDLLRGLGESFWILRNGKELSLRIPMNGFYLDIIIGEEKTSSHKFQPLQKKENQLPSAEQIEKASRVSSFLEGLVMALPQETRMLAPVLPQVTRNEENQISNANTEFFFPHQQIGERGLEVNLTTSLGKRERNEDFALAMTITLPDGSSVLVAGVFDGMGGHNFGERASFEAAKAVYDELTRITITNPSLRELVIRAAQAACSRITTIQKEESLDLKTTGVILVIDPDGNWVGVNIGGDSGLYQYNEKSRKLTLLTPIHSYAASLLAEGKVDRQKAENIPQFYLTRGVEEKNIPLLLSEITSGTLNKGEYLCLATDGAWKGFGKPPLFLRGDFKISKKEENFPPSCYPDDDNATLIAIKKR